MDVTAGLFWHLLGASGSDSGLQHDARGLPMAVLLVKGKKLLLPVKRTFGPNEPVPFCRLRLGGDSSKIYSDIETTGILMKPGDIV